MRLPDRQQGGYGDGIRLTYMDTMRLTTRISRRSLQRSSCKNSSIVRKWACRFPNWAVCCDERGSGGSRFRGALSQGREVERSQVFTRVDSQRVDSLGGQSTEMERLSLSLFGSRGVQSDGRATTSAGRVGACRVQLHNVGSLIGYLAWQGLGSRVLISSPIMQRGDHSAALLGSWMLRSPF